MGYMHIKQLYKCPEFFKLFHEIYAMEKIHGTSAWILLKNNNIIFNSGGEKHDRFKVLFDGNSLKNNLMQIIKENSWENIRIHGDKQQKMATTYGPNLKFIVFDILVKQNNQSKFLDIPDAQKIAERLGLEFVSYTKGSNTFEWIEEQTKIESVQAIRNGMGGGKLREGIVVRPLHESVFSDGTRAICKHKNAEFNETTTNKKLGENVKILEDATEIINEWVTEQRYQHVLDRVLKTKEIDIKDMKKIIEFMVEDVQRESKGEIVWNDSISRAIRQKTAHLFKTMQHLKLK